MSARDEWFRNVRWDAAIAARFDERLSRARDKAQPLRIQATLLAEDRPDIALQLLDRYFAFGDHFDSAAAHVTRAHIHRKAGDVNRALTELEAALDDEERKPNYRTSAWIDYAMLVAEAGISPRYERALDLLQRAPDRATFPVERFRAHGARALILAALGHTDAAADAAIMALAAAEEKRSPFHNHRLLGLVTERGGSFEKRVAALTG